MLPMRGCSYFLLMRSRDIFEKTITLQVMTEDKNRLISVDGGSHYRYPSIDAQSAEITITKVQLGYMCMPDSEAAIPKQS